MFTKVIEIIDQANDQAEAQQMVDGLKLQQGVWGARIIGNDTSKAYAAQAFMDLPEDIDQKLLPDGMSVRYAPPAVMAMRRAARPPGG